MRSIQIASAFFFAAAACGCVMVTDGTVPAGGASGQEIAFTLKQAGTNCDVKRGPEAVGRLQGKQTKLKVTRNIVPLELQCTGKDASRLAAQLKPIAGTGPGGFVYIYPEKVTVDMAARKVFVPEGWTVE
jgi:hypothetical protein